MTMTQPEKNEEAVGVDALPDNHVEQLSSSNPETTISTLSLFCAVISVALGFVCPILCIALFSSVVTQIANELGDPKDLSWPISGFSVAGAVSFSIAGSLSDIFGRRVVILSGNVLMIVGTIVGATAHSVLRLTAAESIIGFATGLVFIGYAGISELLPNKWRGAGIGLTEFLITVPWNLTSTLISTSIYYNTALSWRWFYIMAAMYATISTCGVFVFYFPPARPAQDYEKTRWQEFKEIDFVGCIFFGGGLCSTLISLSWAGTQHPWKSTAVIAPLVVGVCSIASAVVYDAYVPISPLFPPKLTREIRGFVLILVVAFVDGFIYFAMSALLPQATLFIFTSNSTQIGTTQIPNGIGQLLFGPLASACIGLVGHLRTQFVFWVAVMVIATACLATTIPHHKAAFMALQPFAVGPFSTVTALTMVMAGFNIPLRYLGLAVGLLGSVRSAGGSLGNAILQTILQSEVDQNLSPAIVDASVKLGFDAQHAGELIGATIQDAVGVPAAFASVPGATAEIQHAAAEALKIVYAHAFQRVFYTTIPFGVFAIVCAAMVRDPSQHLTNQTAVRMEKEGILGNGKKNLADDPLESKIA